MSVLYQTECVQIVVYDGFGSSLAKVEVHQHIHHLLPVTTTHHSLIVFRIRAAVPAVFAKEDGNLHHISAFVNIVPVVVDENRSSNSLAHFLLRSTLNSLQDSLQFVTVTRPQVSNQDFLDQSGIVGFHPLARYRFNTLDEKGQHDDTA